MTTSARRIGILLTLAAVAGGNASAQGPRGADTLSLAAIADSQKTLTSLLAQLQTNRDNAALWHRVGLIAWALRDRAEAPKAPETLEVVYLTALADSALRQAARAAPNSAYYRLMVGKFMLSAENPFTRSGANGEFFAAVDIARKNNDSIVLSEAAVEAGRVHWRRFDSFKNRRMKTGDVDIGRSISDVMIPVSASAAAASATAAGVDPASGDIGGGQALMKSVRQVLDQLTMQLPSDVSGAIDYEKASAFFREAYSAAPANTRAFRSMAMLLADSSRWRELDAFSRGHLDRIPWDPSAWLALGLAKQRLGDSRSSGMAFDSAFVYLDRSERNRLDQLVRVLRPADTARFATASPESKNATALLYWRFADPLWSQLGNEPRIEFLARVTFAEFRWTVDELNIRGAETDRGRIFIRYGPPDLSASIGPRGTPNDVNDGADVVTYWLYRAGLAFTFSGMPTYASAYTPVNDQAMVAEIETAQPVRWDNIAVFRVDTMPVQMARFRGGRDSVDILVATRLPYDSILAASDVKERITSMFWLLRGGLQAVYYDTATITKTINRTWTRRVAPGHYVYRAEASSPGSKRAGRVTAEVLADVDPRSGFAPRGFGLSDVLLATSVDPAVTSGRWAALRAQPLLGGISKDSTLTVIWENYEFGARGTTAEYTVSIALTRDHSTLGRIAARVVGRLAGIAQVDVQPDRMTISFDRTSAHSTAIGDQVQLALSGTPAGRYTLQLEVTDKVSGKKVSRTTSVLIQD